MDLEAFQLDQFFEIFVASEDIKIELADYWNLKMKGKALDNVVAVVAPDLQLEGIYRPLILA